jgi:cytosine/adenosine deaminase-related metal-dependent hydrolase
VKTAAWLTAAGVVLGAPGWTFAQPSATVFTDVNLIRLDQERVESDRTVVVQGDRIVAIGRSGDLRVPDGADIVDGRGRFLLPGLVDSHVHVTTDMPWAPTRADFGDGLLYLAHGVTTVVNLRGTPAQLEWKQRVAAGELLAPTLYTAGEFVNEPRVVSAADVEREVLEQARLGYDLIKFHEVWEPDAGGATRRGLSREGYDAIFEAAREAGLPVVGHAPVNLGLDGLLASSGGALAHIGELNRLHFVLGLRTLMATGATALVLLGVVAWWGAAALSRWMRQGSALPPGTLRRARVLFAGVLMAVPPLFAGGLMVGPGGLFYESASWRIATSLSGLALVMLALVAVAASTRAWRDPGIARRSKMALVLAATSGFTLVLLVALGWLPFLWRTSEPAIGRLAVRFRESGVGVQSTLVVYEALSPGGARRVVADPSFAWLAPQVQALWRQVAERRSADEGGGLPPRLAEFIRMVAGVFHRRGVLLLAGTDAMGVPLVTPGSSLVRELHLLQLSGLTPYEALRTATVNPARFLGQGAEFGTIAVGSRADLLLLDRDPLESVSALDRPAGVMARGRWLPRERLEELLSALR